MEALIAILVLVGMLTVGNVLPGKSAPTAPKEASASAVTADQAPEGRPACDEHGSLYRDLTIPYEQRTAQSLAKAAEDCDE